MCYSYRDREAMAEARRAARDEERRRREEATRREDSKPAQERDQRERELIRA